MTELWLGLILFLGVHSLRIVAEGWRERTRERLGAGPWKGLYSLLSLLGLALIAWGYGQARQAPTALWTPPVATRHAAALLMLVSFVLLAAAYVPHNALKARLHHPMLAGVVVWALAHLLANGQTADLLLFGSFALWAGLDWRSAHRRDLASATVYPPARSGSTAMTVLAGLLAWAAFTFWGHRWLIGVSPLGL